MTIPITGPTIVHPVDHVANVSASPEEAARIASSIRQMVRAPWTDKDGVARVLRPEDFMVVAPYNA